MNNPDQDKSPSLPLARNNKFMRDMITSASPEQLIILLYDGAIQWLQMAKREIQSQQNSIADWTNFNKYMHMSTRVINHLQESLDFKVQDEVTRNLFGVYSFLYNKINKATISKDEAEVEAIIEFLRDLRSTWSQAVKIHQQKLPVAQ